MKSIHIGGALYGAHNVGDEAVLVSIIKSFAGSAKLSVSTSSKAWLKKKFPEVSAKYFGITYIKPRMGIDFRPSKNPLKLFEELLQNRDIYSNKDLFICGGGSILSDCPWHSLKTIEILQKHKTNAVIFGAGMSDIKDDDVKVYLKKVCNSLEDVYVRDEFVKGRLHSYGVKEENVKVSYDPALMLLGNEQLDAGQYLDGRGMKLYMDDNIKIAVTLSGEVDCKQRTNIESIRTLVNYWIKEYNANIFLIPTNIRRGQDLSLLEQINGHEKVVLIEREFFPEDLVQFLSKFSFILSSRLHMNILGAINGVPSIGLVRNSKIIDFAKLLKLNFYSIENPDFTSLMEYSQKLIRDNGKIRSDILKKVSEMKSIHTQCVQEIKKKYL